MRDFEPPLSVSCSESFSTITEEGVAYTGRSPMRWATQVRLDAFLAQMADHPPLRCKGARLTSNFTYSRTLITHMSSSKPSPFHAARLDGIQHTTLFACHEGKGCPLPYPPFCIRGSASSFCRVRTKHVALSESLVPVKWSERAAFAQQGHFTFPLSTRSDPLATPNGPFFCLQGWVTGDWGEGKKGLQCPQNLVATSRIKQQTRAESQQRQTMLTMHLEKDFPQCSDPV